MLFTQRASKKAGALNNKVTKAKRGEPGVVEPDTRIVFAVLAVGMLVGALLTTPAKPSHDVKLKAPGEHKQVPTLAR